MTSPSFLHYPRGADSRESCRRDYSSLPSFFPHPPFLSPHSPTSLTFNQKNYEKKWSLKLNCHSNIAPRRQAFKTSRFPSGVVPGHQPIATCLPNSNCMESTTTEWQRAYSYRRRPTTLETQEKKKKKKTTETETRSPLATVYACTVPFPAKFGCQPIKLQLFPLVHTYPANYVRVHFKHPGVYKGSRVAYRAIRVRVS